MSPLANIFWNYSEIGMVMALIPWAGLFLLNRKLGACGLFVQLVGVAWIVAFCLKI